MRLLVQRRVPAHRQQILLTLVVAAVQKVSRPPYRPQYASRRAVMYTQSHIWDP